MKNYGRPLNPRMGNDSGLLRTRMKKNNLEESKETTMNKNRITKLTGRRGCRKKTHPRWRMNFVR